MTSSNDTKTRIDRVLAAVGRSAEVMNDMTPSQMALIDELGVEPVELWLGILALLLPAPADNAGRSDDHHSKYRRRERTTSDDDNQQR